VFFCVCVIFDTYRFVFPHTLFVSIEKKTRPPPSGPFFQIDDACPTFSLNVRSTFFYTVPLPCVKHRRNPETLHKNPSRCSPFPHLFTNSPLVLSGDLFLSSHPTLRLERIQFSLPFFGSGFFLIASSFFVQGVSHIDFEFRTPLPLLPGSIQLLSSWPFYAPMVGLLNLFGASSETVASGYPPQQPFKGPSGDQRCAFRTWTYTAELKVIEACICVFLLRFLDSPTVTQPLSLEISLLFV